MAYQYQICLLHIPSFWMVRSSGETCEPEDTIDTVVDEFCVEEFSPPTISITTITSPILIATQPSDSTHFHSPLNYLHLVSHPLQSRSVLFPLIFSIVFFKQKSK